MWVFFAVYVQQKGKHPQIYFLLKKRRYVVIVVCITQSSAALLFLVPTLFQRKYFLCPSAFLSHKGSKTAVVLNPFVPKCFLRPPATLSPVGIIVVCITQSSASVFFLSSWAFNFVILSVCEGSLGLINLSSVAVLRKCEGFFGRFASSEWHINY